MELQKLTGIILSPFALLHLANHAVTLFDFNAANSVMASLRVIYQNPFVELGVLLPATVLHLGAGFYRTIRNPKRPWNLRRITGSFITFFMFGHVLAVRVFPFFFYDNQVTLNEYFIAHSVEEKPHIFVPYYIAFSVATLYHTFSGLFYSGIMRKATFKPFFWVGSAVMIATVMTLAGYIRSIPYENLDVIEKYHHAFDAFTGSA